MTEKSNAEAEIADLEKALPVPYAFKSLISKFRQLGKQAKSIGDLHLALENYNKILSLSYLWHEYYGTKTSGISGGEVDKAAVQLNKKRKKGETIYAYNFLKDGPVKDDVLLSKTDYKYLEQLSDELDHTKHETKRSPMDVSGDDDIQKIEVKERIIHAPIVSSESGRKSVYLNSDGIEMTIEKLGLEYYESRNAVGVISENTYWWEVLALLYWDVIFAKLDGVYHPEFGEFPGTMQDMPQDLFTENFYPRRKDMIQTRSDELLSERKMFLLPNYLSSILKSSYHRHKNQPCRLIEDWKRFSLKDLLLSVRGLERNQLVKILEHLLENFIDNRRGLPDLFIVKDDIPTFVEVKSENETISSAQTEWHQFLIDEVGLDVEILRVVSKD